MSAEVVSMINWKGGVGKSTLSLHLAVGLMLRKTKPKRPRVLLIDLDPQCNLSYLALGVSKYVDSVYENGQLTLKDIFDSYFDGKIFSTSDAIIKEPITASPGKIWKNVDILPSHSDLVLVDMRLARERKSGTSHQEETKFELDKLSIIYNAIKQVEDFLIDIFTVNLEQNSVLDAMTDLSAAFVKEGFGNPDLIKVWLDWSAGINQSVWQDYQELLKDLHERVRKVLARGKRENILPKDFNTMAATRLYIGSGHTLQLMIFDGASKQDLVIFQKNMLRAIFHSGDPIPNI